MAGVLVPGRSGGLGVGRHSVRAAVAQLTLRRRIEYYRDRPAFSSL